MGTYHRKMPETLKQKIICIFGFALFFLAVSFHFASADTYTRTPNGNGAYNEVFLSYSADTFEGICPTQPFPFGSGQPDSYFGFYINDFQPSGYANIFSPVNSAANLNLIWNFSSISTTSVGQIGIQCYDSAMNKTSTRPIEDDGVGVNSAIFSITPFVTAPATEISNIWGSKNGFWGSTTPAAMLATVSGSVQATGANIWPLFKILGVLVGFMIAYYLVYFIKLELEPRKVAAAPGKTEEFIEHSPADLEFKGEYGAEPIKRKRGRPRKVL